MRTIKGTIWRLMTSTWSIDRAMSSRYRFLTFNLRPHQAVVDFQSVDFLVDSAIVVFERTSTFNNVVDTLLRLLSQVQPTLIRCQHIVDGLGENAAGNGQNRYLQKMQWLCADCCLCTVS